MELVSLLFRFLLFFCVAFESAEVSLHYRYSRAHRALELSAIAMFAALAAGLAWKVALTVEGTAAWIILTTSIGAGYVLADLVSGIVHWLADRYGTTETPLFGANFIRPFREHHIDPKAITEHDFVETNGSNCIVSVPCMAFTFFVLPVEESLFGTFLHGGTLAFCLSIFATNQFHKWAHMDSPPLLVPLLRRCSLILTPEHHDTHHTSPYDRHYCITVGWWNPVLERLKLFERIETVLAFVTGARPAEEPHRTLQFEHDLKELI